jgi:fructosamine-3-kinase
MSDLLSAYQETYPMRAKNANRWFDFGNIDNLVEAKQKLLQTRFFNTLTVDPVVNTITKMSQYDEKLQNELDWYEALPDRLKVLAPRIISKNRENGKLHLVSEYYGYPTLAELFVFSDLHVEYWSIILQRLMRLHMTFKEFESNLPADEIAYMYASKTFERIELLQKQNNEWREIFSYHEIFCNGNQLINFTEFKDAIYAKSELLAQNCKPCIMHGDFCFSNILYDLNNHIVRLIDPRGSFGRKGIYGDPRYDLAKLRHSICGWYDYITADLFEVERQENSFKLEIFVRSDLANLKNIFDHLLAQYGYDTKEIRFIEGLLFISMLPLHKDKPMRQQAMFLTGLQHLNEVLL